jgi:hypothetical protein
MPDVFGERRMFDRINRPVPHLRANWIIAQIVVASPVDRRTYWPRHEPTTAIWTNILQNIINTGRAERALVRANAGFH